MNSRATAAKSAAHSFPQPAVAVDHGVSADATAKNGFQRALFVVWHDLCVALAIALQETKDDSLYNHAATPFTTHAGRAEVRLGNLDFAILDERLALALFGDVEADVAKDRDDRAVRDACQLRRVGST